MTAEAVYSRSYPINLVKLQQLKLPFLEHLGGEGREKGGERGG